jgi:hypothetical protein
MSIFGMLRPVLGAAMFIALLAACVGGARAPREVVLPPAHDNVISYWHDVGVATVNAKVDTATTAEEKRPVFQVDLATMHLAMYDAVSAIDGRYKAYAVKPVAAASGASLEAAASAAAYGVLRALFPNRGAYYHGAYDTYVAAIPAGDARNKGLALGAEAAAGIIAKRAGDGRSETLVTYVPGTKPGNYRGLNPINRPFAYIRPFALTSKSQFRSAPPPPLDSAAYAADFNEVKSLGGIISSTRTAEQLEMARFHTESPAVYFTRNLGKFARSTPDVADAARLMAILYAGYSDAIDACAESKYFYQAWRPLDAIVLADSATNPATIADAAWKPSLTTPGHPEYPAAHSCTAGALGELLRQYYGTDKVTYTFDSKATNTSRTYRTTDALTEESVVARIYGGMHFRYSTTAGAELGKQSARWTMAHYFGKRDLALRLARLAAATASLRDQERQPETSLGVFLVQLSKHRFVRSEVAILDFLTAECQDP